MSTSETGERDKGADNLGTAHSQICNNSDRNKIEDAGSSRVRFSLDSVGSGALRRNDRTGKEVCDYQWNPASERYEIISLAATEHSQGVDASRRESRIGPPEVTSRAENWVANFEGTATESIRDSNYGKRGNYVPLFKWDLKFSGNGLLNANQFIERVEELAGTRRVPETELFEGILELLSGEALLWYRVHKGEMRTWEEFKKGLKTEFLPLAYEEALWREIRSRKQGPGERINTYIHCMLSLIGRLKEKVSEERKLELVLQNLSPDFSLDIRVARPKSLSELYALAREVERGMTCTEDYKSSKPVSFKTAVEKDCAYDQRRGRGDVHEISAVRTVKCFNCEGAHFDRDCREPRRLKCYGCGKLGVTRADCDCSGNRETSSKNARRN